jgi:acyl carrier protein
VTRDTVSAVVKKHMIEIVEELADKEIDTSRSMKDYGLNSLDMVDVVSASMRELKVKVPRAEMVKLTNLDGLIDLLLSAATKAA